MQNIFAMDKNFVLHLTKSELKEFIIECLRDYENSKYQDTKAETYFTVEELATFLRLSPITVRSNGIIGQIPHIKTPKAYLFDKKDVIKWQKSEDKEKWAKEIVEYTNLTGVRMEVVQIDANSNKFIKIFKSSKEAVKKYGSSIPNALAGNVHLAYKYKWRYLRDLTYQEIILRRTRI